jgi:glutamyl-tRNA reductase
MTDTLRKTMIPFVVGANHRSSGLSFRDRLFVEDVMVPGFLQKLSAQGVSEALVLSTCDRVEVQGVHEEPESITPVIREAFAHHAEMESTDFGEQLYSLFDEEALRHIMRVASSLDSQVIGEPQVLGQVKAAHRIARDAGAVGGALEAILQGAYNTAKQIMTDTAIGERPVSIAAGAVQLARDVQGDLGKCRAVLIGDAEMGEMVSTQLLAAGIGMLTVMNDRAPQRAKGAARRLECHSAPWENLSEELDKAEILITALGRRVHTINVDMIRAALAKHRRKLMFIVDLALPGDVDPAVNRIDEAFLYDIGDLERVAMDGKSHRESEAQQAEAIIEQALVSFDRDRAERAAVPALSRLRRHVEAMREQVLKDAGDDVDKATNLLANRLLHEPSIALRDIAAGGNSAELGAMERAVERLFALSDADNTDNEEE